MMWNLPNVHVKFHENSINCIHLKLSVSHVQWTSIPGRTEHGSPQLLHMRTVMGLHESMFT